MNAAVLGLIGLIAFALAYRFYARYISEKVFRLQDMDTETPAHAHRDGIDYVPTGKNILVGHHFSSIAGAAPRYQASYKLLEPRLCRLERRRRSRVLRRSRLSLWL